MSQESGGEWIVHLPDLDSYQEYVDANIELSQKFPDVHFFVDPKTSTRYRITIPRPDQYPFRHTHILEYESAKSEAIKSFFNSSHYKAIVESTDNGTTDTSTDCQVAKTFVESPSYITTIIFLMHVTVVFYLKERAPQFLILYLIILYCLFAAPWVLIAYVLVPCLVRGIKSTSLAVWRGSVIYLTMRAAPIYVLGKEKINHLMRIKLQLIWTIFCLIIAFPLTVYALYLLPETFRLFLDSAIIAYWLYKLIHFLFVFILLPASAIIVHWLYKGIQFLFVSILLPASAMISRWLYKRMNFFFLLSIFLLRKFRNIGSSWQKQNRKMGRNRRVRNTTPSRRTSTNRNQLFPPRVDASQKTKRGLRGFANGHSTAGIADTGAAQNVVSLTFAQSLGLEIKPSTHKFQLGSSKQIMSLGTVQFQWAFSEDTRKTTTLTCHVLRTCIYDLILGRRFLDETQTLSKYQHRLSQCVFFEQRSFKFGLLGETFRRMEGTLGSHEHVLALPDTGAERNVIDFHYAKKLKLDIDRSVEARNYLQFADGSYSQTLGQTHTHWTFASGKRIPITFEVLKNCASNVVIGEQILYENKVFTEHVNDFRIQETEKRSAELAPFDFLNRVEGVLEKGKRILEMKKKKNDGKMWQEKVREQQVEENRREAWNESTDFGKNVDEAARRLERERREMFEKRFLPSPVSE